MEFYTLASGSSGNCSLVCAGDTLLLIDAGISCRRIEQSLRALGRTLGDLTAAMNRTLTRHGLPERTRQQMRLATLSKKSAAPVYVTRGVSHLLTCPVVAFTAGDTLEFAGCTVRSFSTSHDAVDPVGYRVDAADGSLGILTDTGFVTDAARAWIRSCSKPITTWKRCNTAPTPISSSAASSATRGTCPTTRRRNLRGSPCRAARATSCSRTFPRRTTRPSWQSTPSPARCSPRDFPCGSASRRAIP